MVPDMLLHIAAEPRRNKTKCLGGALGCHLYRVRSLHTTAPTHTTAIECATL